MSMWLEPLCNLLARLLPIDPRLLVGILTAHSLIAPRVVLQPG